MSAHEIFAAAEGFMILLLGISVLAFILFLMGMWGLYLAGKAQQSMASTLAAHLDQIAAAQTARAEHARQLAAAAAITGHAISQPLHIVQKTSTD